MEDMEIKETYAMLVKQLSSAGRLTASGRIHVEKLDQIFRATGEESLMFQGVVGVIASEEYGNKASEDQIEKIKTSLRGFLKSEGSPFETFREGKKLMIKRKVG
jgi:hypothetical protein